MQHLPLDRLTIKDGKIYELYNGKLSNPFMGISELNVTKKLAIKERDHGTCEFLFEMNALADPVWVEMFTEQLGKTVAVAFQGDRLVLTCAVANLERDYLQVKDAMGKTNARYATEREQLMAKIVAKDDALSLARKKQEDRTSALREQFERLKL